MNFLAHLWLADRTGADLAGAVLGDWWRGAVPADMPPALAQSVRLHRRIDVLTDAHPRVAAARTEFAPGARRYAGILLDLLYDHALAQGWARYTGEPLPRFARRAAEAVTAEARWFEAAGGPAPAAVPLAALLESYAAADGIDRAVARTARRLRRPQGLIESALGWRDRMPRLADDLPLLLADLEQAAVRFRL